MINFKEIQINGLLDYNTLRENIPEELVDDYVMDKLKKYINDRCDRIIVEFPYYDNDYLSTYYIHYAKKMISTSKHCCRLHFLKDDRYFGYMVLRPTIDETKISRTLLEPELFVNDVAYLMLGKFKAHLLGTEAEIRCFPWMSQETDISVCAHVAVWSLLKYYGNSYKDYMDTTVGAIVDKTTNSWGRKTPSLGLSPVQVSDIMKEYGFSPLILGKNSMNKDLFFDTVIAYIESGIPLIGFVDINDEHHAVTFIGHAKPNYDILDDSDIISLFLESDNRYSENQRHEAGIDIIPSARLINTLYVSDDRVFPYMQIAREMPVKNADIKYSVSQLRYAIVPLYQRMQLSYKEIYVRFIELYKKNEFDWSGMHISRIYITSSTSLKAFAAKDYDLNDILKKVILQLTMSRFVWCVDLATPDEYKTNLTSGRLIADTTAATYEDNPWILIHDSKQVQIFDAESKRLLIKKIDIKPYKLYEHNLKVVNERGI